MTGDVLERWLEEVIAAPGATGTGNVETARAVLLDDALRAAPVVRRFDGPVVDVGSGGGSPGLPLAVALPHLDFTLLESERRKCAFLTRHASRLPNVQVTWGRAEEQTVETFGVALAKALARPPVAAELCLPLVRVGGAVVLWLGPTGDRAALATAAEQLGGRLDSDADGLVVLSKVSVTPSGFPRRPGVAKKRPLA